MEEFCLDLQGIELDLPAEMLATVCEALHEHAWAPLQKSAHTSLLQEVASNRVKAQALCLKANNSCQKSANMTQHRSKSNHWSDRPTYRAAA